jgi:hypothetical protein
LGVDRAWWLGRSSKPRWRRPRWLRWVRFPHAPATLALTVILLGTGRLAAQDSVRARPDTAAARSDTTPVTQTSDTTTPGTATDSLGRPVSKPVASLWRSLLIPGWGQVRLGRKLTAGLFVLAEGVTLGMALHANSELQYLRRTGADSVTISDASRKREDWLVLLGLNHLLAGLEAFIAANLEDFPGELKVERIPHGVGASVSLPVRLP